MNRLLVSLSAVAVLATGCKCGGGSLGPLVDQKPADLGPTGLSLEQPKDGETVNGQWVAVSGWFDPAKIDGVFVSGGSSADLYAPGGHVGIPTAPVLVTKEGRFLAPRVSVDEGATELNVMGFKQGVMVALTKLNVTGTGVASSPITVVADPPFGTGTVSVKLAAFTGMGAAGWQWDFEGDGTFDSEEATPTHSYAPGRYGVLARTRIDNRWVYGVTALVVSTAGTVGETTTVGAPRSIAVVPDFAGGTRSVLVADGDEVRVYGPTLALLSTLTGLSAPSSAAGDAEGRVYVSDTGHDLVKRFTPTGALDLTFGDGGVLGGISKPGAISVAPRAQLQADGGTEPLWRISVLDGTGHLVEVNTNALEAMTVSAAPFGLAPAGGVAPKDFVHPLNPEGTPDTAGAWFTATGTLFRPGISEPKEVLKGVRSYAPHADATNPYVAAIDLNGDLVELLGAPWNRRFTDLDFDATAVALDPAATAAEHRKADPEGAWSVGPVVLYVGGTGRLERRVMPLMRGMK